MEDPVDMCKIFTSQWNADNAVCTVFTPDS
jgi:hypothetical protein